MLAEQVTPASRPRRHDGLLAERGGWAEVLWAPALLFAGIARLRSALYSRRLAASFEVGAPVVSVGNIAAGGTGKTPMIAWLAGRLRARGLRAGIVSRGYGAARGDGVSPKSGAEPSGAAQAPNDEARMLAEILPDVPHLQDRDRVGAASRLVDQGLDVILVDDGFQHRRLARDVDLVLLDALRPFGLPAPDGGGEPVEAPLPRGLMREPMTALRRASAVVLTRVDAVDEAALEQLERRIERAAPGVPVLRAQHVPVAYRDARDPARTRRPLSDLDGLEVDLVSGIGNPGAFELTAGALGAIVRSHRRFPDHHAFAPGELDGLGEERPVLTTAKDAARLEGLPDVEAPEQLLVLDVEMSVTRGEPIMDALLDTLPPSQRSRERASIHEGLHG